MSLTRTDDCGHCKGHPLFYPKCPHAGIDKDNIERLRIIIEHEGECGSVNNFPDGKTCKTCIVKTHGCNGSSTGKIDRYIIAKKISEVL